MTILAGTHSSGHSSKDVTMIFAGSLLDIAFNFDLFSTILPLQLNYLVLQE